MSDHRLMFFGVQNANCSCGEVFVLDREMSATLSAARCQDRLLDTYLDHVAQKKGKRP